MRVLDKRQYQELGLLVVTISFSFIHTTTILVEDSMKLTLCRDSAHGTIIASEKASSSPVSVLCQDSRNSNYLKTQP